MEPDADWSDQPSIFNAKSTLDVCVAPYGKRGKKDKPKQPTQIVLHGRCPRCGHPMTSEHPVRGPLTEAESVARVPAWSSEQDKERAKYAYRVIAARCRCSHTHAGAPEGESGCGAPFALAVRWPKDHSGPPQSARAEAGILEHAGERRLQETLRSQLEQVRKAAQSWRTGLGGFLAVLAVVFFVKGKTSFDQLDRTWQWRLAVLLALSGALAVFAAYRAVRAAHGTPADEYIAGRARWWRTAREVLPATTPRHIHDYDTVGAWKDAIAAQSVTDLMYAKVATVLSAVFFVLAAGVTWLAPGPPNSEQVIVDYGGETACGRTLNRDGQTLVVDGKQRIDAAAVTAIRAAAKCPP